MNLPALDTLTPKRHWRKSSIEGLSLYQSSVLRSMPSIVHGFTTRAGGCSEGSYSSLNMGSQVGDNLENVQLNRRRVAGALGFTINDFTSAQQVHGSRVERVDAPGSVLPDTDALITDVPNILLMLMFADCVPVFIFDPLNRAIGLIHSGWKGAEANVVQQTITSMTQNFGTDPSKSLAAIGPCISFDRYEIGLDVAERFRSLSVGRGQGSAQVVVPYNEFKGTYLLNLRQVIFQQLNFAGFRIESVAVSDQCTYSNSKDFFSHRRDSVGGAKTGRMAAVMGLKTARRSRGII